MFLLPQTKGYADPLQNRKVASAWFGKLPALDVLARQQQVIHAFSEMRRSWTEISRHRISAIAYIDAAFESEHRRLIQWYLENLSTSPKLAARFRQAAIEVNQAFLDAYQTALDPACGHAGQLRWKPLIPLLFTRLIRCHGIDAKLRLFNREQWIPARWTELHQLFLRATELRVENVPVTLDKSDPFAVSRSAEQEYVYALLIAQLDTGNLSPAELQWASVQLRAWTEDIKLDASAPPSGGFYVDLAGNKCLVRRTGNDHGAKVGYVDTTGLARQLDRAIAKLSEPRADGGAETDSTNRRHLAILKKIRPALIPTRAADLRRHPRIPVDIAAAVQVGLSDINSRLATKPGDNSRTGLASARFEALRFDAEDAASLVTRLSDHPSTEDNAFAFVDWRAHRETGGQSGSLGTGVTEYVELHPFADHRHQQPATRGERPIAREAADPVDATVWRLKDRSVDGWRVCASASNGQSVDLDALMAMRPADGAEWMLGVVRRVHKRSSQLEAGVALIANRIVAINLHARRPVKEELSVVVDGVDVASIGPRFAGLYLLAGSRPATGISIRTLVIPTSEYGEGRRLMLATGRWNYTIVLRQLIEQRGDWSWATMEIAEKLPRTL